MKRKTKQKENIMHNRFICNNVLFSVCCFFFPFFFYRSSDLSFFFFFFFLFFSFFFLFFFFLNLSGVVFSDYLIVKKKRRWRRRKKRKRQTDVDVWQGVSHQNRQAKNGQCYIRTQGRMIGRYTGRRELLLLFE